MLLDSHPLPVTETSLASYFTNQLNRYAKKLRPAPQEDTCWYLGGMLDRFSRSEHLFTWENGQFSLRPLALLYGDAIQATNNHERCLLLQHLGDMSLFMGALFPARYARHGIRQDYFIGMGGSAYDYLADNARQNRHIFSELANTFVRILEMITNVCSRGLPTHAVDILALYQRWLESGDPLAERQLRAIGIDLQENGKLH